MQGENTYVVEVYSNKKKSTSLWGFIEKLWPFNKKKNSDAIYTIKLILDNDGIYNIKNYPIVSSDVLFSIGDLLSKKGFILLYCYKNKKYVNCNEGEILTYARNK